MFVNIICSPHFLPPEERAGPTRVLIQMPTSVWRRRPDGPGHLHQRYSPADRSHKVDEIMGELKEAWICKSLHAPTPVLKQSVLINISCTGNLVAVLVGEWGGWKLSPFLYPDPLFFFFWILLFEVIFSSWMLSEGLGGANEENFPQILDQKPPRLSATWRKLVLSPTMLSKSTQPIELFYVFYQCSHKFKCS